MTVLDPVRTAPLSQQQEFFRQLDFGDEIGAFGRRHVVAGGWRLRGGVDVTRLREALDAMVVRHEMLRTAVGREDPAELRVGPPGRVHLQERDLREGPGDAEDRAEAYLVEIEGQEHPVDELPHLRAALGVLADDDAVLVLVVHHVATDGWSMHVLLGDLIREYARLGAEPPEPAEPPPPSYADFTRAQRSASRSPDAARETWRKRLRGARFHTWEVPPGAGEPERFVDLRYTIGDGVADAVVALARKERSSAYMVLMAAYAVLLARTTGEDDVVVPTFIAGRSDPRFHGTVGPFLNMLPLRIDLTGCEGFRDVLRATRAVCLESYANDIPFDEIAELAPELMESMEVQGRVLLAFEVLQFPGDPEDVPGAPRATEIRRRVISTDDSCHIPDGMLWALDVLPEGEIAATLKFDNRFDTARMRSLTTDFTEVLRTCLTE